MNPDLTKERRSMPSRARSIAPEEVVALNRAVTSEPIASGSSGSSVGGLFVSADVSTDAEEDQEQFQGK